MHWLITFMLAAAPPRGEFERAVCAGEQTKVDAMIDKNPTLMGKTSPLALAAKCDQPDMVRLLLKKGGSGSLHNAAGNTAMHEAVLLKDDAHAIAILTLLATELEARSREEVTVLAFAARADRPAIVAALLKLGAQVEAKSSIGGMLGETALHFAAAAGSLGSVQHLLAAKARVDAIGSMGGTPLMAALAARTPKLDVVKALVAAGADVNATSERRDSVLGLAVRNGDAAIVDAVVAKVDLKRFGPDAVDHCAFFSHVAMLERLIAAGVALEPTATWQGALHAAVRGDRVEVIRLVAKKLKNVDVVDPTSRRTALQWAADSGLLESVKVLLELGANPALKDAAGQTARDLAEGQGAVEVVRLLMAKQGTPAADTAEQQFAVIFGGGKQPADATAWLTQFNAEGPEIWKPQFTFTEGFPRTFASADVPGMNPGFHVVVLGFCGASELGQAMKLFKGSAERIYARKVTSAPQPGTCPQAVLRRAPVAFDVSTVGDGLRLHLVAFEGRTDLDVRATVRDAKGALVASKTFQLMRGDVRAAKGELRVDWEDPSASCGPPSEGTQWVRWKNGRIEKDESNSGSSWGPNCGE